MRSPGRDLASRPGTAGTGAVVPDPELLAKVAGGDRVALAALYERHGKALLAWLVGLAGDFQLAEEVLQDTLVTCWKRAGSYRGEASVRAWLCGIARQHLRNRRRRARPDLADVAELEALPDGDGGPEDRLLAAAAAGELASLLGRLRPGHQEVLVLMFVVELPQAEIAELLGVPVGTVKSRLHAARKALAALLASSEKEQG